MPALQPGLTAGEESAPLALLQAMCPQVFLDLPLRVGVAALDEGIENTAEEALFLGHGSSLPRLIGPAPLNPR
jgi:hypothetical protein